MRCTEWTKQQTELLAELADLRMPDEEIAVRLGEIGRSRSPHAVKKRREMLGIRRPPHDRVKAALKGACGDDFSRSFTPEELKEMDDRFCAAMEAAGYKRTGPRRTLYERTLPMRLSPPLGATGSGWQIDGGAEW